MTTHATPAPAMPLVVQVAFAGKRLLLTPGQTAQIDLVAFQNALATQLAERLRCLPEDLSLSTRHQVVALSSLAMGGDMLFTRACQSLGWWQRILLPQARSDFLAAGGSSGPDFSPDDADAARRLLASPHIIEERVVSVSADRYARFEDVNLEMVRVCDVFVCLLPAGASTGKRGATFDVMELAKRWHKPVLELRLSVMEDGRPQLAGEWQRNLLPDQRTAIPGFAPPGLPAPLDEFGCDGCDLTNGIAYRQGLKDQSSKSSGKYQWRFTLAALFIVGAHGLATAFALVAIKTQSAPALKWLLGFELCLLGLSLLYHHWLHRSHAVRNWAMARLSAEVARSAKAFVNVPLPLRHFLDLSMPDELRPLLRTLNVLQLAQIRSLDPARWTERRKSYLDERMHLPKYGQLDYYGGRLKGARRWLNIARGAFYVGSAGAFFATAGKLSLVFGLWSINAPAANSASGTLGFLAVLLPVLAVAGLSLAAAFDLEARVHTYEEMLAFLHEQTRLLESAATENEFATLALRTEAWLLGETAKWHARRAFTGVA